MGLRRQLLLQQPQRLYRQPEQQHAYSWRPQQQQQSAGAQGLLQHTRHPLLQLGGVGGQQPHWLASVLKLQQPHRLQRGQQQILRNVHVKDGRTQQALLQLQRQATKQKHQQRHCLTWTNVNEQRDGSLQRALRFVCDFSRNSHAAAAAAARMREEQAATEARAAAILFPPDVAAEARVELLQLGAAAALSSTPATTESSVCTAEVQQQQQGWGRRLSAAAVGIVRRVAASAIHPPLQATAASLPAAAAGPEAAVVSPAKAGASSLAAAAPDSLARAAYSSSAAFPSSLPPSATAVSFREVGECSAAATQQAAATAAAPAADASSAEAAAVSVLLPGLLSLLHQLGEEAAVTGDAVEVLSFISLLQRHLRRPVLWDTMTDDELASTAEALEQVGCTDAWIAEAAAEALLRASRYTRMSLPSAIKASKVLVLQQRCQQQLERQARLTTRQHAAKQLQRLLLQKMEQALQQQQLVRAVLAAGRLGPLSHAAAKKALAACRLLATHVLHLQQQQLLQRAQQRQQRETRLFSQQQQVGQQLTRLHQLLQQQQHREEREILAAATLPDEELLQLPAAFAAAGLTDEPLFLWAAEQLLLRLGGPSLHQLHQQQIKLQQQQARQHLRQQHQQHPTSHQNQAVQQQVGHYYRSWEPTRATSRRTAELVLLRLALLQRVGPPGLQQPALPLFCRFFLMPALAHMPLMVLLYLLEAATAASRQLPQQMVAAGAAAATLTRSAEEQQQLQRDLQKALQKLAAGCLILLLLPGTLKRLEKQRLLRLLHAAATFVQQHFLSRQQQLQQLGSYRGTTELETALAAGLCRLYAHLQQHMRLAATSRSRVRNAAAALMRGKSPHTEQKQQANRDLKGQDYAAAAAGETAAAEGVAAASQNEARATEAAEESASEDPTHAICAAGDVRARASGEDSSGVAAVLDPTLSFPKERSVAAGTDVGSRDARTAVQLIACRSTHSQQRLVMAAANSMLDTALRESESSFETSRALGKERPNSLCALSPASSLAAALGDRLISSSSTSEAVQALISISVHTSLLPSLALLSPPGTTAYEGETAAGDTSAAGVHSGERQLPFAVCRTALTGAAVDVGVKAAGTGSEGIECASALGTIAESSMFNQQLFCQQERQQPAPPLLGVLGELLPIVTRVCCGQESALRVAAVSGESTAAASGPSANAALHPRQHFAETVADVNDATTACVRLLLNFIPTLKPISCVLLSHRRLLRRLSAPEMCASSCVGSQATGLVDLGTTACASETAPAAGWAPVANRNTCDVAAVPAKPPAKKRINARTLDEPVSHTSTEEAGASASGPSSAKVKPQEGDTVVKAAASAAVSPRLELPPAAAAALSCCSLLLLQLLLLIPDPRMNADASAYSLRGLLACVHRTPEELLPFLLSAPWCLPWTYFIRQSKKTRSNNNEWSAPECSSRRSHPRNKGKHSYGSSSYQPEGSPVKSCLNFSKDSRHTSAQRNCAVVRTEGDGNDRGQVQSRPAPPSAAAALAAPVALLLERFCAGATETKDAAADPDENTCALDEQLVAAPHATPNRGAAQEDAAAMQGREQAGDSHSYVSTCSQREYLSCRLRVNAVGPCLAAAAWLQQQDPVAPPLLRQHLQKIASYHDALLEEAQDLLPLLPARELRLLRLQLQNPPSAFGQAVLCRVDGIQPCD